MPFRTGILGIKTCSAQKSWHSCPHCGGVTAVTVICRGGTPQAFSAQHMPLTLGSPRSGLVSSGQEPELTPECFTPSRLPCWRTLCSSCDRLLAPLYGGTARCSCLGLRHRGGALFPWLRSDQASSWRRARWPERPLEQHKGSDGHLRNFMESSTERCPGASCMYRLWEGRTIKGK